jgi:hypothetical protein
MMVALGNGQQQAQAAYQVSVVMMVIVLPYIMIYLTLTE